MPFNNPGSLSQQQYFQVLGYLLVENNIVTASTAIYPSQLAAIMLK
jgi:hypothetical protein